MHKLTIKLHCRISANCIDEETHELDDDEWAEWQQAKQEDDGGRAWLRDNLIEPEMLSPDIAVEEDAE